MDFTRIFEQIETQSSHAIRHGVKSVIRGDGTFLKLKKLAKKSAGNVPDFINYVHAKYHMDIERLSEHHGMQYEDIAQLFISA